MKINLTLEVSDDLRRLIGKVQGSGIPTTQDGLATRLAVIEFIRSRLNVLDEAAAGFSVAVQPTEQELIEYEHAISYLKAGGMGETDIKRWIFKQRARRDFINTRL